MIEKKKRVKALAAERLKAETDHYLAVARAAEAEAALAKERFKHENSVMQRQRAHAKEVGACQQGLLAVARMTAPMFGLLAIAPCGWSF